MIPFPALHPRRAANHNTSGLISRPRHVFVSSTPFISWLAWKYWMAITPRNVEFAVSVTPAATERRRSHRNVVLLMVSTCVMEGT